MHIKFGLKKEGNPSIYKDVETWMSLVDFTLNEISQRKTNAVLSHLCVEFKKVKLIATGSRMVATRTWEK